MPTIAAPGRFDTTRFDLRKRQELSDLETKYQNLQNFSAAQNRMIDDQERMITKQKRELEDLNAERRRMQRQINRHNSEMDSKILERIREDKIVAEYVEQERVLLGIQFNEKMHAVLENMCKIWDEKVNEIIGGGNNNVQAALGAEQVRASGNFLLGQVKAVDEESKALRERENERLTEHVNYLQHLLLKRNPEQEVDIVMPVVLGTKNSACGDQKTSDQQTTPTLNASISSYQLVHRITQLQKSEISAKNANTELQGAMVRLSTLYNEKFCSASQTPNLCPLAEVSYEGSPSGGIDSSPAETFERCDSPQDSNTGRSPGDGDCENSSPGITSISPIDGDGNSSTSPVGFFGPTNTPINVTNSAHSPDGSSTNIDAFIEGVFKLNSPENQSVVKVSFPGCERPPGHEESDNHSVVKLDSPDNQSAPTHEENQPVEKVQTPENQSPPYHEDDQSEEKLQTPENQSAPPQEVDQYILNLDASGLKLTFTSPDNEFAAVSKPCDAPEQSPMVLHESMQEYEDKRKNPKDLVRPTHAWSQHVLRMKLNPGRLQQVREYAEDVRGDDSSSSNSQEMNLKRLPSSFALAQSVFPVSESAFAAFRSSRMAATSGELNTKSPTDPESTTSTCVPADEDVGLGSGAEGMQIPTVAASTGVVSRDKGGRRRKRTRNDW